LNVFVLWTWSYVTARVIILIQAIGIFISLPIRSRYRVEENNKISLHKQTVV